MWPDFLDWRAAFEEDQVECVKYARETGAQWSNNIITDLAVEKGAINCLKYVHEHGAVWTAITTIRAAAGEHLACLQYCHEHGSPWDVETARMAARNSSAACLQYCHEHGCPWDETTLEAAVRSVRSFDCVKYAIENGCKSPTDEVLLILM